MKKLSLIFTILATVCCGRVLGGSDHPESRIAVLKNGEVFKVIYQGPEKAAVRLTILDSEGQEIFTEKVISTGGFVRPYNFSQLPKGDYRIKVVDGTGEHFEELCYRDQEWIAHITKIGGGESRYMIAIPCREDHEIEVHIYDQYQELIFTERHQIKDDFAMVYNLINLKGATIKLVNQSSGEERVFQAD